MNRIIKSIFIVFILFGLINVLPINNNNYLKIVKADDSTIYSEGSLYYTIDNGSVTIVGCFGQDEKISVPSQIAGYPVNTIGKKAFDNNTYLKEVELPDTITTIENGAFASNIEVKQIVDNSANVDENDEGSTSNNNNQQESNDESTTNTNSEQSSSNSSNNESSVIIIQSGNNTNTNAINNNNSSNYLNNNYDSVTVDSDVFDEEDVDLDEEEYIEEEIIKEESIIESQDDNIVNNNQKTLILPFIIGGTIIAIGVVIVVFVVKKS